MNVAVQDLLDEREALRDDAAVAVRGLNVFRGDRRVLHGLDFRVARGRITGLLGPSGCGKTTLMRAIVGVQVVESGAVVVRGEPAGSPAVRARVGYVMQAPAVYQDLSARENLRYFARVLGAPATRVAEALEIVQLSDQADRPVRGLSGGQRARVSLGTYCWASPTCWCSTSQQSDSTRCFARISGAPSKTSPPAA